MNKPAIEYPTDMDENKVLMKFKTPSDADNFVSWWSGVGYGEWVKAHKPPKIKTKKVKTKW